MRASNGPEYRMGSLQFEAAEGETIQREVRLERWVDMPARGWFSGDDHLHIARPVAELNPVILQVMQAEDIRIAKLLQFGIAEYFHNAVQIGQPPDAVVSEYA